MPVDVATRPPTVKCQIQQELGIMTGVFTLTPVSRLPHLAAPGL